MNPKVEQKVEELRKNQYIVEKYDKAGIYSIGIKHKIVYIGKSKNMLVRLANHIVEIEDNHKSNKYSILRQCKYRHIPINFDVIYYATQESEQELEQELGQIEGKYIRKLLPLLNTQIPKEEDYKKYYYNKQAQKITFQQVLDFLEK